MVKILSVILVVSVICSKAYATPQEAITAFESRELLLAESIWQQQNDADYRKHLYLAKIALLKGDIDLANRSIKQALKLQSADAEVYYIAAKIRGEQAENANVFSVMEYISDVKRFLTKAVELSPENVEYLSTLIHFHVQAPSILGGDIKSALSHAHVLKGIDKMLGMLSFIQAFEHMGEGDKFANELALALREFSGEPEFYYRLGLYYQQKPDYQQAFIYFRQAINLASNKESFLDIKHHALFQFAVTSVLNEENQNEAERALFTFIDDASESHLLPSKYQAKLYLADFLLRKGDKATAEKFYRQVAEKAIHKGLREQGNKMLKKF